LPEIFSQTIDHKNQRYDTAGDYTFDDEKERWDFLISKMDKAEYEFMVFVHELVEAFLCYRNGVAEEDITNFDLAHIEHPDPGRIKTAPYHTEHMFAMKIERMLCKKLGLNWEKYDGSFENLEYKENNGLLQ
jgi:hypothetical protein